MTRERRTAGRLCVLASSVIATSVAHAQPQVELGAYGGLTSSKPLTYVCIDLLLGDPCSPGTSTPHYSESGFALGAYLRVPVHPIALLEADLLYAQKGENGGPNGLQTTHHYVELPLLAQVDPLRTLSHARVFALAGVSPAIRVGCTTKGPIFDNDTQMVVDYSGSCEDLPPPLNRRVPKLFDFGVVVGAGVGWELPFGTVELQARYTRGLVDTRDDDGGKTINRTFFVMAGFGMAVRHRVDRVGAQ
jgi:hypothetical protein